MFCVGEFFVPITGQYSEVTFVLYPIISQSQLSIISSFSFHTQNPKNNPNFKKSLPCSLDILLTNTEPEKNSHVAITVCSKPDPQQ